MDRKKFEVLKNVTKLFVEKIKDIELNGDNAKTHIKNMKALV